MFVSHGTVKSTITHLFPTLSTTTTSGQLCSNFLVFSPFLFHQISTLPSSLLLTSFDSSSNHFLAYITLYYDTVLNIFPTPPYHVFYTLLELNHFHLPQYVTLTLLSYQTHDTLLHSPHSQLSSEKALSLMPAPGMTAGKPLCFLLIMIIIIVIAAPLMSPFSSTKPFTTFLFTSTLRFQSSQGYTVNGLKQQILKQISIHYGRCCFCWRKVRWRLNLFRVLN